MNPRCAYPNTQSAANAVHRWIKRSGVPLELTARPWNRFDPVNTEWWLIPSTHWPAYRHGKLFFRPWNSGRDLFCGLFVEKGLGSAVAAAFPTGKRLVMDRNWVWHRLLNELEAGPLDAAVREVVQRSGATMRLYLDGGFVEDPSSYDPDAPPMDWNRISFDADGKELRTVSSVVKGDQFAELPDCASLPALALSIRSMLHLDWTWIDFHLGAILEMAPLEHDPEPSADRWQAADIWRRCLNPWRPWVI